jgi:hypothetical protein
LIAFDHTDAQFFHLFGGQKLPLARIANPFAANHEPTLEGACVENPVIVEAAIGATHETPSKRRTIPQRESVSTLCVDAATDTNVILRRNPRAVAGKRRGKGGAVQKV